MTRLGKLLCVALLASTTALLAACGTSGSAGAGGPKDSITLYNGQHEQTTALLVAAFEKQTGIKVHVRSADEATLGNQILQEQGNSPADVFYAENTPVLELLRERGYLAPVDGATLAAVPRRYSSAVRRLGRGIGPCVRARLQQEQAGRGKAAHVDPRTRLPAMARARWGSPPRRPTSSRCSARSKSSRAAPPRNTGSQTLKADGKIYPDNETVVAQVNNGESAIGPINHYYWYRLHAEEGAGGTHSALQYFKPGDPGNLVDVSGAAVLKSSAHQTAAQRFVAFLVSAEGQQVIARSNSFEYPLRPGVAPAAGLPPFSQVQPNSLTPAELGDGRVPLEMEQRLGLL